MKASFLWVKAKAMARAIRELSAGQVGSISLSKLVTTLLLAFVGLMFVIEVGPQIETAVLGYTGTNAFVEAILGMASWILPVGALVGIFYGIFRMMGGGKKQG